MRKVEAHYYEGTGYDGTPCMRRHNKIYRRTVDKCTGNTISDDMILKNDVQTMYYRIHIH